MGLRPFFVCHRLDDLEKKMSGPERLGRVRHRLDDLEIDDCL